MIRFHSLDSHCRVEFQLLNLFHSPIGEEGECRFTMIDVESRAILSPPIGLSAWHQKGEVSRL